MEGFRSATGFNPVAKFGTAPDLIHSGSCPFAYIPKCEECKVIGLGPLACESLIIWIIFLLHESRRMAGLGFSPAQ